MDFIQCLLEAANKNLRPLCFYAGIYTFVAYVALVLTWEEFGAFDWMKQLLFSAGTSVCVGVMMCMYYPLVCRQKDPALLIFLLTVLITMLYMLCALCFNTGFSKFTWFPIWYVIAFFIVLFEMLSVEKKKSKMQEKAGDKNEAGHTAS